MNLALGTIGVYLGVIITASAVATLVAGLVNRRADLLKLTPWFAGSGAAGRAAGLLRHGAGPHHP